VFRCESVAQVRGFLTRARRLDPAALVRLRPGAPGHLELWTVLPFDVLATITTAGRLDGDITVRAGDLDTALPAGPLPARADHQWRGALPAHAGTVLEQLGPDECRRIGTAAGQTLAQARGKGVGDRRLRDVLLDHVALRVIVDDTEHPVQLRLVLGLLRMGFVTDGPVLVRHTAGRLGLQTDTGTVWTRAPGLAML
jgi:hypothetical protein